MKCNVSESIKTAWDFIVCRGNGLNTDMETQLSMVKNSSVLSWPQKNRLDICKWEFNTLAFLILCSRKQKRYYMLTLISGSKDGTFVGVRFRQFPWPVNLESKHCISGAKLLLNKYHCSMYCSWLLINLATNSIMEELLTERNHFCKVTELIYDLLPNYPIDRF